MMATSQASCSETLVDLVPLMCLRAGQLGRVCEVLGTGDLIHRLREMGLRDGAEVQMIRPGSPCIIRLDGQKLGFRTDELARVMVRTESPFSC